MKWIIKICEISFLLPLFRKRLDYPQLLLVTVLILHFAGPVESWLRSTEYVPSPFFHFLQPLHTRQSLESAWWNTGPPASTGPNGRPFAGPASACPSCAVAFYWFCSLSAAWALAPPHYHYLSGDSSLPLIKIYIATFIRWYNTVNRISGGSSSLIISMVNPCFPSVGPCQGF